MNPSFSRYLTRGAYALMFLAIVTMAAVHLGCHAPIVLVLAKGLLGTGGLCAVAYPIVNATTYADQLSDTLKASEELWVRRALFGADRMYQINPWGDNMTGDPGSGKAIIRVVDTQKVNGKTVNIPLRAGFGGPGVAGGGMRSGTEQKIRAGNMQVTIGKFWFGAGYQQSAKDQTITGEAWDQMINDGMMELHARQRSNDHYMRLIQATKTPKGARNLIYADGISGASSLKSVNVVTAALLSKINARLSTQGAVPMNLVKDWRKESSVEQYMIQGTNLALTPLKSDPLYADAINRAAPRSNDNPRFTGSFADYDGIGIYRWYMRDHSNEGPIGSPLTPRAVLGLAVANAGNGTVLQGGGFMYNPLNTNAKPFYFEHFPGAPYQYYNGDQILAETVTTKYLRIYDPVTGKNGVFPYNLSDGYTITLSGAAQAVGNAANRDVNFSQGSLVVPCEANGTPTGYLLGHGGEVLAAGVGSINGSPTPEGAQMGRKTQEIRNHGEDIAIGLEGVWGNQVVSRIDGLYPNFCLAKVALPLDGMQDIV